MPSSFDSTRKPNTHTQRDAPSRYDGCIVPSIFISAGEASGEFYGAQLAAALAQYPNSKGERAELWGMGGPHMAAAGVDCIVRAEDVAVMGFTEIVGHLPHIYREFLKLKRAIRVRRPALAVLIDFPEVHFRLAREFHRLGIPVIYFVSPQLWAWKPRRIRLVRKYVKRMLVIFPFEEQFYRDRGVAAEFVGHPLADLPPPAVSREQIAAENGLDPDKIWIGLLPGSRLKEIEANLPEMLKAARAISVSSQIACEDPGGPPGRGPALTVVPGQRPKRACPGLLSLAPPGRDQQGFVNVYDPVGAEWPEAQLQAPTSRNAGPSTSSAMADSVQDDSFASRTDSAARFEFLIPLAPTLDATQRQAVLKMTEVHGRGLPLRLVDDARAALFHARASVTASGTATVEAALLGNPFIVVYRVSPLTYAIAKRLVKVPHVAMANLIAGKRVVPELIQHDFTAANIVQHLSRLLPDGPVRESMMMELGAIREALHSLRSSGRGNNPSAIETVAAIIMKETEVAYPAAQQAAKP